MPYLERSIVICPTHKWFSQLYRIIIQPVHFWTGIEDFCPSAQHRVMSRLWWPRNQFATRAPYGPWVSVTSSLGWLSMWALAILSLALGLLPMPQLIKGKRQGCTFANLGLVLDHVAMVSSADFRTCGSVAIFYRSMLFVRSSGPNFSFNAWQWDGRRGLWYSGLFFLSFFLFLFFFYWKNKIGIQFASKNSRSFRYPWVPYRMHLLSIFWWIVLQHFCYKQDALANQPIQ